MEAASTPRRSLGEYFVEKGLITEADLERAHAEHLTTKRRLADILVKRGLVSGADITRALMDQLGMAEEKAAPDPPAQAEEPAAPPAPVDVVAPADPAPAPTPAHEPEAPRAPELTLVPPADDPQPGEEPWPDEAAAGEAPEPWPGEFDHDTWPGDGVSHDPAPAAPAEAEPDVEQWHSDPWDVPPEAAEHAPVPEPAFEPEPAVEIEPPAPAQPAADLHATIEARQRDLSEALATATSWTIRAAELQGEIDELVAHANAAAAAAAQAAAGPAPDAAPTDSPQPAPAPERTGAVFLVPRPDRFELVELDIEAPAVGETVRLGDRSYVVTKLSTSPLPFDRRSCAVLAETS